MNKIPVRNKQEGCNGCDVKTAKEYAELKKSLETVLELAIKEFTVNYHTRTAKTIKRLEKDFAVVEEFVDTM